LVVDLPAVQELVLLPPYQEPLLKDCGPEQLLLVLPVVLCPVDMQVPSALVGPAWEWLVLPRRSLVASDGRMSPRH
jgi:hypothetical protein